jgi:small subunit ribosomal protein S1
LWVKIIDLELPRRRISLSIKQAAEGGEVAEEYREHFGSHTFDTDGNYIGAADDAEREAAWKEYYEQYGGGPEDGAAAPVDGAVADLSSAEGDVAEAVAEVAEVAAEPAE